MSEEKVKILIVDDRPEGLMTLEAVLSSPEYHLVRASSGDEALRCLLDEDFALILLDVQMPGMNGFETASLIRERPRCRHVPIIFITAINKDDQYVGQGYRLGAVDYLFKPLVASVLQSKVAVFVDLFRKNRQVKQQAEQLRDNEIRERERRLATFQLESQRRYRNLADSVPILLWKGRASSVVDYVNRTWISYTGLDEEQSVGAGWRAAVHPEDLAKFSGKLERALSVHAGTLEEEIRILRVEDETYRWHLVRIVVDRNSDGTLNEWLASLTEIHDRKTVEQERLKFLENERALRRSAERQAQRFSQLAEMVPEFVWEFADGEYWMNHRWQEFSGIPTEKLLGKGCLKSIHPDDVQNLVAAIRECVQKEVPFSGQFRVRRKDGRYRWFLGRALPCRTPDGAVRWVGVATDIQIFRDLDEQRADFLSIASHELKTPLTSLKTTIQLKHSALLRGRQLDVDREMQMLEVGIRSANRLSNLLDDLLDFSRVESGRFSINPSSSDLAETVRESVMSRKQEVDALGHLTVKSEIPDQFMGYWDTYRLRQVLENLLGNAIKYSPDGGLIEVKLRREGEEAVLSVKDQGLGIDPEDQKRIFGAFERAARENGISGFGIGLYVTQKIVVQHRGRIEVESEKGKGSKFTVRLPVR